MAIVWNLRKWLAVNRDIYRPSELQALLIRETGIQLSLQAISALLSNKPQALRMQTVQALCNALNCNLSDFCDVLPDPAEERRQRKTVNASAQLYGGKSKASSHEDESIFPDPKRFKKPKK
jgi:DNA-binding Xre family transcriptional regulator